MIKQITLLKRKPGISPEQFKRHYEDVHAPMAVRNFVMLGSYTRNYVNKAASGLSDGDAMGFDCVTEMCFASMTDYRAYREKLTDPAIQAELGADVAKFMDAGATQRFVIDDVT